MKKTKRIILLLLGFIGVSLIAGGLFLIFSKYFLNDEILNDSITEDEKIEEETDNNMSQDDYHFTNENLSKEHCFDSFCITDFTLLSGDEINATFSFNIYSNSDFEDDSTYMLEVFDQDGQAVVVRYFTIPSLEASKPQKVEVSGMNGYNTDVYDYRISKF